MIPTSVFMVILSLVLGIVVRYQVTVRRALLWGFIVGAIVGIVVGNTWAWMRVTQMPTEYYFTTPIALGFLGGFIGFLTGLAIRRNPLSSNEVLP